MKFGTFDDAAREYVITTPSTPYPWINYLGNEKFFSLISNTAGGYAFHTDARLRRLTRYRYNDVPLDNNGRYLYIRHNGVVWGMMQSGLLAPFLKHGVWYGMRQVSGLTSTPCSGFTSVNFCRLVTVASPARTE